MGSPFNSLEYMRKKSTFSTLEIRIRRSVLIEDWRKI